MTLYTNIVAGGTPPPLAGTTSPVNYGAGTMDFTSTLNSYPGAALAVGLYLSDQSAGCNNVPLRAIAGPESGVDQTGISAQTVQQYRGYVSQLISYLKGTGRAVFLRIGYEFDNPYAGCYNAQFYVAAFKYFKNQINAQGASNIATVWQASLWPANVYPTHPEYNYDPTAANHFDVWYPGDAYVDYVGASFFYGANFTAHQWRNPDGSVAAYAITPRDLQNKLLSFARSHNKPVMIAESSPQGFDLTHLTASSININSPVPVSAQSIWNEWYQDYFNFIQSNQDVIKVVAYINSWWQNENIFQCAAGATAGSTGCPNGYWGDARIQANATIENLFDQQLQCSYFVNGTRNCGAGAPTPTPVPGRTPTPIPPTPTPGGTITVPGTLASNIGAVANGQILNYSVKASTAGTYALQVTASSIQNSRLLGFVVDNGSEQLSAFDAGTHTFGPPYFPLSTGTHTISVRVHSDSISISSIVVNRIS